MSSEYILIYDSGSGGEYVLNLCKAILPNEKFILFKDTANCPYGNKSYDTLYNLFFNTLKKLSKSYQIKALVLACNTMSSMFGKSLKRSHLFPKIFLITPPLNIRMLKQPTLLLATNNTCKYNQKIIKNRDNKNLFILPLPTFALEIDKNRDNLCALENKINEFLYPFKNYNIKNVILGCTHYNYITPLIIEALNRNVIFYENSLKAVLNLKKYLHKNIRPSTKGHTIILTSI